MLKLTLSRQSPTLAPYKARGPQIPKKPSLPAKPDPIRRESLIYPSGIERGHGGRRFSLIDPPEEEMEEKEE